MAASAPVSADKDKPDPKRRIYLVGDSAEWVETGIFVRSVDYLTIRAGSEVCFSGNDDDACVRAEGWPRDSYAEEWPESAADCTDPFPEFNHAMLLARVGEEVLPVGKGTEVGNVEGELHLTVNDCSFEGAHRNDGQFSVVVAVENPVALAARHGREAIEAALEAMGGKKAIGRVGSLAVRADCTGPEGDEFTTEVLSIRPDRTLFRQSSEAGSAEWVAVGDKAWRLDREQGKRKAESKKMRETIRSHEFHLTLFEIETRFKNHTLPLPAGDSDPAPAGDSDRSIEPEPTADCTLIEMEDLFGLPASVCLDPESSLPLQLRFQPAGQKKEPPIEVELESWREIDDVLFLEAFTLRQGDAVFTYKYDTIEPNSVAQGVFKEVSETAFAEIRKRAKGRGEPDQDENPAPDPEREPEAAKDGEPEGDGGPEAPGSGSTGS